MELQLDNFRSQWKLELENISLKHGLCQSRNVNNKEVPFEDHVDVEARVFKHVLFSLLHHVILQ